MLCPLEGLSEFHDSFCVLRMQIGATERTEGKVQGSKKKGGDDEMEEEKQKQGGVEESG